MKNMISKNGTKLKIRQHIILKNFWEYYITDRYPEDSEIQEAFVMGFENELGDVYLPEIKPYIISKTNDLEDVAPASGFSWEEGEE